MAFRSQLQPLCNCTKFQNIYSAVFLAGMYCIPGWSLLFPANPFPETRCRAEQAWHALLGSVPPSTPAHGKGCLARTQSWEQCRHLHPRYRDGGKKWGRYCCQKLSFLPTRSYSSKSFSQPVLSHDSNLGEYYKRSTKSRNDFFISGVLGNKRIFFQKQWLRALLSCVLYLILRQENAIPIDGNQNRFWQKF